MNHSQGVSPICHDLATKQLSPSPFALLSTSRLFYLFGFFFETTPNAALDRALLKPLNKGPPVCEATTAGQIGISFHAFEAFSTTS